MITKFRTFTSLLLAVAVIATSFVIGIHNGATAGVAFAGIFTVFGAGMFSTTWITPHLGANALGSLSGSLILQEALQLTFAHRPLLKMISKGFREIDGSVENALLNQSVITRTLSIPSVGNFGDAASDIADTDVPVVLNGFKQVFITLTAAQYNATNRDVIREEAQPIATAIANHIVDSVSALWVAGNFAKSLVTATNTRADLTLPLMTAMDGTTDANAIPADGRFAVFNGTVYGGLLADPVIVAALNNPSNGDAIKTGKLPAVDGIQIDKMPTLGNGGAHRVGFAGTPDSTCYAARAPKDPSELLPGAQFPGVIGYVEDPATGFRVMVNQWIGTDLSLNNRIIWLEGYAVGNENNGIIISNA